MRLSALLTLALVQLAVSTPRTGRVSSDCCYRYAEPGKCGSGRNSWCPESRTTGCSEVSSNIISPFGAGYCVLIHCLFFVVPL